MNERLLQKMIDNPSLVDDRITEFVNKKVLFKQDIDEEEIRGHILKAENNLRFVAEIIPKKFFDWALTGCYYACYHAALALIQTKGFTSKNHFATLYVMIKEFYNQGLDKEDIELFSEFLDYDDILFYVEAKQRREDATYSTKLLFNKKEVNQLRIKAALFVNKVKELKGNINKE